ncbi:MAG: DoxX family protein [Ilumatobacter sp.]|jgi:uncharacterized membrane protein YphA (DoxX/SURF4 family)|uniref:DoxX family protein n=1 Tax=Ilumatobacter sp. TaxID=1967498 RepID=UPI001D553141|nr:DoxX family protein [Ilumatobacter sp.]MBT5275229.1 DoxX family protein [Ilumatobacter sp.]MBT5552255.1 DoxX family protein [Ilumatobacter sp.]MBT5864782.1 DoxX family protein [Ilumatobacter sp.]MBT7430580.1 DoxX family protein [Ilumatobacter sp.]
MLLVILAAVSALAFLYYGAETLFAARPRREFERYGMPQLRVFVGSMQLLGAAGVLIGIFVAPIGAVAAAGLTIMMLLGLVARYRIHDAPRLMIPASSLALLNAMLVFLFVTQ